MGGLKTARVGVFGGTFDPIHLGHLLVAAEAQQQLGLDRVLFVPAGDPPHKPADPMAGAEHRYRMLQAALAKEPLMVPVRFDLDRAGPHYTVDMLGLVASAHPEADLHFIMGADSLRDFPDWRLPVDILAQCRLAVAGRPGVALDLAELARVLPAVEGSVDEIQAPWMSISGTDIRRRIAAGRTIRYQVPETVEAYIYRHRLYRTW